MLKLIAGNVPLEVLFPEKKQTDKELDLQDLRQDLRNLTKRFNEVMGREQPSLYDNIEMELKTL